MPLEMQTLSRQTMMNAFDYFKVFHTNVFITSRYLKKKPQKLIYCYSEILIRNWVFKRRTIKTIHFYNEQIIK